MNTLITAAVMAISVSGVPFGNTNDLEHIQIPSQLALENPYLDDFEIDTGGCDHYGDMAFNMATERDNGKTFDDQMIKITSNIRDMATADPEIVDYVFLLSNLAHQIYIKYPDISPHFLKTLSEKDCYNAMENQETKTS